MLRQGDTPQLIAARSGLQQLVVFGAKVRCDDCLSGVVEVGGRDSVTLAGDCWSVRNARAAKRIYRRQQLVRVIDGCDVPIRICLVLNQAGVEIGLGRHSLGASSILWIDNHARWQRVC